MLLTDLYQLTMAHAYFKLGMRETAVFELFVRRLPPERRFLVAAGLQQVLEYLEELRFTPEEIAYLRELKLFPPDFLQYLLALRFTGTVHAMPEGTPFFGNEPVIRVTAPILEAQLVESRLLNLVHFQTLIASKAARCVLAAQGRRLVDFGMRRAHGAEAALHAARATFLAGFDATATVEAGRLFGVPLSGTVAHSFIEAHDAEEQAFRRFVTTEAHPTALLIDTYDTARGARRAAALARELQRTGAPGRVQAVRIDSGDLAAQAHAVRQILDGEQCRDLQIILSGNLDEYRVAELLAAGAPADAFGIGTHLDVSADVPALDMAYKLQEYAGRARRKRSPGKETWPGAKQVFRRRDAHGQMAGDTLALAAESCDGAPLLQEVMRGGQRVRDLPTLETAREYCRAQLTALPSPLRDLAGGDGGYEVEVSARIRALAHQLDALGE